MQQAGIPRHHPDEFARATSQKKRMESGGDTCSQCNLVLVKQNLVNGLPLSAEQKKELEEANLYYSRILQCEECGSICYHNARSKVEPPKNGTGKCKKCGGIHQTTKPKGLKHAGYYALVSQKFGPKIWSCPIHGSLPHEESTPNVLKRKFSTRKGNDLKGIFVFDFVSFAS